MEHCTCPCSNFQPYDRFVTLKSWGCRPRFNCAAGSLPQRTGLCTLKIPKAKVRCASHHKKTVVTGVTLLTSQIPSEGLGINHMSGHSSGSARRLGRKQRKHLCMHQLILGRIVRMCPFMSKLQQLSRVQSVQVMTFQRQTSSLGTCLSTGKAEVKYTSHRIKGKQLMEWSPCSGEEIPSPPFQGRCQRVA